MADAVVSFVVNRLGDFLIEEVAFLQGVRDELRWMRDELRYMKRFLEDAEEKQYEDAIVREWVSDIREVAYDIEDLFDTLDLKVQRQPGCFPSVCSCMSDKGNLYNIGRQIEDFKSRLTSLTEKRDRYKLQDSSMWDRRSRNLGKLRDIRRATSFAVEKTVVGFEDEADKLLSKLLSNEPQRFIISIYGMGGLGKTTLARKLYHNKHIGERFSYKAWISVSQDYTTRDLLQRIIKSFDFETIKMEELEKMNAEYLERNLYKALQERSYLVVIDDVWDKEAWASLKRAFPDNENGSRVIITTRNKEVAERSDERTYAHKLRFLRLDESWQLFREKTFQKINMDDGLEKLGREMVEKCDGLPLAIIVLGGILSTKKPHEWHVVHDEIWRHLKNDSLEISHLLTLSFNDLPYQLKQCFLYLGIFPEDFEINIDELIHLFVAEGFIPQYEDRIMEEVAKDYLEELINRSLLQVVEKRTWNFSAICRVHDLIRDLAIEKAKHFNFFCIYDEDKHSNISSIISICSRQVVHCGKKTSSLLDQCNPHLRSLFLFKPEGQEWEPAMFRKFRSLRVLYVSGVQIRTSEEIGKLIHLKYLKIPQSMNLFSLSIFNLQRLQTLALGPPFFLGAFMKLSAEVGKLQELRHLLGYTFSGSGTLLIDNLKKLQTLYTVDIESWIKIKSENLTDLRDLWLCEQRDVFTRKQFSFDSVAKIKSLRILSVILDGSFFRSFQSLSHCQHLIELRLDGKMEKLPEDIHVILPNLEILYLRKSFLHDDPMPLLEKLPNLVILLLHGPFYRGKKLICSANGFYRLEVLEIEGITELQVEERALPSLRCLQIPNYCELITPETVRSRIQKTLVR